MKALLLSGLLLLASCQDNCEFMGYNMPCKTAFELSEQKSLYYNVSMQEQPLYQDSLLYSFDKIMDIHFFMQNAVLKEIGREYKKDTLSFIDKIVILK